MTLTLTLTAIALRLFSANPVHAQDAHADSVSVGMTNSGRVLNSVELEDTATHLVKRGSEDARWGTAEIVAMITEAAGAVATAHPGSRLIVGDISRRRGGRARPHRSHRAGRDVDLGFYLLDAESGEEVQSDRFIDMTGSGRGRNRGRTLRFDVARNWALMRSVLESSHGAVQYVMISPLLRRLLIRHGRATNADATLLERFGEVSARRSGSASHRSHFHIRIYCAVGDRPRCVDAPPFHAWVFTSDAQVDKAVRDYRQFRPPRRARRRRARHRGRMRRRGMRRRGMGTMAAGMSMARGAMGGGAAMGNRTAMGGRAAMGSRTVMSGAAMGIDAPP